MPKSTPTESKKWNKRKENYLALRDEHGSVVNRRRVIGYIAGQNRAADPEPMTRQVRRQNDRTALKGFLHGLKNEALKSKRRGGAAAILSVADA